MPIITAITTTVDPKGILLIFAAFLSLCYLIYFTRFAAYHGKYYFRTLYYPCILYAFFMTSWILSNVYFHTIFLVQYGENTAIIMARVANIFSILTMLSVFIYSCHLTSNKEHRKLYIWQKFFISFTVIFTLAVNLFQNYTISHILINAPSQFTIYFGKLTIPFFITFSLVSIFTLFNLITNKNSNNKIKKTESTYIAIGFTITSSSTIVIHLIITFVFHKFSLTWLPPVLSSLELLIIGYAIMYHRFYSRNYLLYLSSNFIIILLIYLIPIFIIIHSIDNKPAIIIAMIWTFSCSLFWRKVWQYTGQYLSLIIYGQKQTPVDKINALGYDFQVSIHQAINKLSDLLKLNKQQVLISDANNNELYSSYLLNNDSVLLVEELEYKAETMPDTQLQTILTQMSKHNTAMILPLYDHHNTITRLLITPHKKNGASYSNEEISALQRLLKKVQTYIYNEYHVKQSQAIAQSIAHEMRNPLGQIQLHLEKIDNETTNSAYHDELHNEIKQAKAAIYHGNQIIDLMLQEAHQPTLESDSIHPYSISQLIQSVINDFAFDSESTEKRVKFSGQSDFTIVVNDVLFSFILFNLLRNAIYYFNEYPESTIEISLQIEAQENRLHFKDYGPGITPHVQQRIFDDFFTYQKSGGTGLGLSYCQRVMNLFDGYISCQSVYGEYTIFSLHFLKTTQPPCELSLKQEYSTPQTPIKTAEPAYADIKVLITDDDLSQRQLVRLYLEKLGINVEEAENGQQAIEKVKQSMLDLVFMDVQMPVIDGFQACESIKALCPQLPVIALSGETGDKAICRMNQLMDDRLAKPATREHLETMLAKWVPQFTLASKIE
ncbi:MAG: Autoinducer 1 sensor kinase/phosphatase LuxN [Candidatus Celerinatantimonas neptuna]|nr:MAG: Autoinducer 1 sensor kinase/phosphatase LuxN [Candidatus Celerinatantimonas neptuna]